MAMQLAGRGPHAVFQLVFCDPWVCHFIPQNGCTARFGISSFLRIKLIDILRCSAGRSSGPGNNGGKRTSVPMIIRMRIYISNDTGTQVSEYIVACRPVAK
jgi:hypothetical protein